MKAIFTRYIVNNMLHETGDDVAIIDVYFKTAEKPEAALPYILHYDKLLRFIEEQNEPVYKYLSSIRNGIHGYGPKHSKVFEILQEENFDLDPFIKLFIESITEDVIADYYERAERKPSKEAQEKLEQHMQQLDKLLNDDFVQYNIKFNDFKDELDKNLHELTFKYFPELFEKSNAHIDKYRDKLSRAVIAFADEIDRIMADKL